MGMDLFIAAVLFVLSFLAGMLGLGVAFIAIPVLGLFGFELKHVIMPWALLLNGLTAISAAVAYLRKKMVDMKTALAYLIITTLAAPIGVYLIKIRFCQHHLVDFRSCSLLPGLPHGLSPANAGYRHH